MMALGLRYVCLHTATTHQPPILQMNHPLVNRSQAAEKLAAIKQQHALLRKEVKWISKLDI